MAKVLATSMEHRLHMVSQSDMVLNKEEETPVFVAPVFCTSERLFLGSA